MRTTSELTWEEFDKASEKLIEEINLSKKEYDLIVGINRGGLPLSVTLSHKLNIEHSAISVQYKDPYTHEIETSNPPSEYLDFCENLTPFFEKSKNILLVDDDCDSGYLLLETEKWLYSRFDNIEVIDSAVLYYWNNDLYSPTYFYQTPESKYIQHPWDKKIP